MRLLFMGLVSFVAMLLVLSSTEPTRDETNFVKACGELNYEKFTFQNIKKLQGQCVVPCGKYCTTLDDCKENQLVKYIEELSKVDKLHSSFIIAHKGLTGSWKCKIIIYDDKIKAAPYYIRYE